MKKYNIFDGVELYEGNRGTIININGDVYKVKITDENGQDIGVKYIRDNEIKKTIVSK